MTSTAWCPYCNRETPTRVERCPTCETPLSWCPDCKIEFCSHCFALGEISVSGGTDEEDEEFAETFGEPIDPIHRNIARPLKLWGALLLVSALTGAAIHAWLPLAGGRHVLGLLVLAVVGCAMVGLGIACLVVVHERMFLLIGAAMVPSGAVLLVGRGFLNPIYGLLLLVVGGVVLAQYSCLIRLRRWRLEEILGDPVEYSRYVARARWHQPLSRPVRRALKEVARTTDDPEVRARAQDLVGRVE